ncbi:MAG: bifunctional diguanylate cyclase/phosphodiesterase [Acidimicrobiales bacterium]
MAVLVLLAGIAASVLGGAAWSRHIHRQAVGQFQSSARQVADALTISLQRDAGLTSTAAILVESTPKLTNGEFSTWFHQLAQTATYPGSFGLTFIEKVPQTQLAAFQSTVETDPPFGLPPTTPSILTPTTQPSPICLTRTGVVQLSKGMPLTPAALKSLIGLAKPTLNYCAMPVGTLLKAAESSGQPAAANLATLVASTPDPKENGITTALLKAVSAAGLVTTITPVYASGKPATKAARIASLSGWVLGVFQAADIVLPVLAGRSSWSAALSYANPSRAPIRLVGNPATSGDLSQTFKLMGPGAWSVSLSAPASLAAGSAQGLVVTLAGLLIALLLFLLIHVPNRARVRSLQLVAQRTEQLRHQTLHDQLTDLPNRELIFDRLGQMLARAQRGMTEIAVLFVDLDEFKDVNDSLGHAAGDDLLCQFGDRLRANLRPSDTIGRFGGDEFVVLAEDAIGALDAEAVARRLLSSLSKPFTLGQGAQTVRVQTASIGIASGVRESAELLIGDADIALYEAKAERRGQYVLYRPEMRDVIDSRIARDAELRVALSRDQFFLVYQPIFSLSDQTVVGFEALLRWRHPVHGVIAPGEFIGSLEASGLIFEVGQMVLKQACQQAAAWRDAGHAIYVSVNASARQFDRVEFVDMVKEALDTTGLAPGALTIEITETCLMLDSDQTARRTEALRRIGARVAIDDFGTGYCSLAYLQKFSVHSLKIDRSFVSALDHSSHSQQLVRTIIQLAIALQLETIAEGVETPTQLEFLLQEHCIAAQGFHLSRPLDVEAATELLALEGQLENTSTQSSP